MIPSAKERSVHLKNYAEPGTSLPTAQVGKVRSWFAWPLRAFGAVAMNRSGEPRLIK